MAKKMTDEELKKSIVDYIVSDESLKQKIKSSFDQFSTIVSLDGTKYNFVGYGCGITYLKVDGRNKLAKQLDSLSFSIARSVQQYLYDNCFSEGEKQFFDKIGNPIKAVLEQDINIQRIIYGKIVEYAKNALGISKIRYISNYD